MELGCSLLELRRPSSQVICTRQHGGASADAMPGSGCKRTQRRQLGRSAAEIELLKPRATLQNRCRECPLTIPILKAVHSESNRLQLPGVAGSNRSDGDETDNISAHYPTLIQSSYSPWRIPISHQVKSTQTLGRDRESPRSEKITQELAGILLSLAERESRSDRRTEQTSRTERQLEDLEGIEVGKSKVDDLEERH